MDYYSDMPSNFNVDGIMTDSVIGGILAVVSTFFILILGLAIFSAIYNWKIYKKAGKNGWESIIPIYNLVVKFQFLNIPMWFLALLFIPAVNAALPIIIGINMAKKFGKDGGFAIGLIFLPIIFYPILAFGDTKYHPEIPGIFDDVNASANVNFNTTNTKFCSNCGIPVVGKFCSKCGKNIEE